MSISHQKWTVADVLHTFGPIPIARVRTTPPPGAATKEDVLAIRAAEKRLYELFDGVLIEKDTGFLESCIASLLIQRLGAYVREHDLGIVVAPDGMVRLAPGLVRIPDVAFVSWDRLPDRRLPQEAIPNLAPDLAIEILSRGNTREEMTQKRQDYFEAGVRRVWEIDPRMRTARIYSSAAVSRELQETDSLDGEEVVPGFVWPLRDFFELSS